MYCLSVDESGFPEADAAFVMCGLLIDARDRRMLAMEFDRIFASALDRRDEKEWNSRQVNLSGMVAWDWN